MKRFLRYFLLAAAVLSMLGCQCPTLPETVILEIPVLGSKDAPMHWSGTPGNNMFGAYVDYTTLNTGDLIGDLKEKVTGEIESIQSVNIQSVTFQMTECSFPLTTKMMIQGKVTLPPDWLTERTKNLFYITNSDGVGGGVSYIGEVKLNTPYIVPLDTSGVSLINQELQRAGLESTSLNCVWLLFPNNSLGTVDVRAFATLKIQFVVKKKVE